MPLKACSACTCTPLPSPHPPKGKSVTAHISGESSLLSILLQFFVDIITLLVVETSILPGILVLVWRQTSLSWCDWSGNICILGSNIRDDSDWSTGWNEQLSRPFFGQTMVHKISRTSVSALHGQWQEWSWPDGGEPWQTMDNMRCILNSKDVLFRILQPIRKFGSRQSLWNPREE